MIAKYIRKSKCIYVQSEGYFQIYKILTSLYIECGSVVFQVAVLYKRGSFMWSGKDEKKFFNGKFCDKPRAIRQIKSTIFEETIYIPKDLQDFLFDYEHSSFLECDEKLAKSLLSSDYKQNDQLNELISSDLLYLTSSLEAIHKRYWLAAGTLLGWQRDCGIIPHTKDADLMMKITDFDSTIAKCFKGKNSIWLLLTMGQVMISSQKFY